jgi:hypothetical protein
VLFTSLGITAMGANNSIFVASHNSLLWQSELHYSSFEKCDCCVYHTCELLNSFFFILSPASFYNFYF